MEISVIIPTHKPEDYLFECLASIQKQTFSKDIFEIIIILNGEKDPYYEAINDYIKRELSGHHVELLYLDKAGVSNARNIGIEQSKGEYLAFVDDDDMVSENYLQGLYNIAKNDIVPLSYAVAFTADISNTTNYYITNVYERMTNKKAALFNIRSYFSSACYKLLARGMVGEQRFNQSYQNGEDSLFMFAVSERKMKMQFTDKTAIYYRRIRGDSLTTRKISLTYKIKNIFRLIYDTTVLYLKTPARYDFLFFISRIAAYFRSIKIFD